MNGAPDSGEVQRRGEAGLPARRNHAALLVGLLLGLGGCLLLARPFFSSLAWACALAVVVSPLHNRLLRWFRSTNLTAVVSVLIVTLILAGTLSAVVPGLIRTALDGLQVVQRQLESEQLEQLVKNHPWINTAWTWLNNWVNLQQTAQNALGAIPTLASSYFQASLVGLIQILLMLFFLFYFLRDREQAVQTLRSLSPLSASETDEVFEWVGDTLHATLLGTVLVGLVQGVLGGVIFWWLDLNAPAFWGLVMGILCMLPVVGPSFVWGPTAILLALGGHWGKAVILVVWGSIVIGLIGNLLYPILVGRHLRLHTVAVFIAMVGGLYLFGVSGFFLGPVTLAVTLALLGIWKARASQRNAEPGMGRVPMDPPGPPEPR